ncbi:hypothetical protein PS15m_000493 [Mucor circinelloides]
MAKGNMDLDRSLDDIIKLNSNKGRGGKILTSTAGSKRHVDSTSHGRQHINSTSNRSSHPRSSHTTVGNRTPSKFHVNSRIGNKPIDQRVSRSDTLINSRLGRGVSKPHRGPGVGSRAVSSGARNGSLIINRSNKRTSERLDPSKIIITKPVINRTATVKKTDNGSETLVIQSKITKHHVSASDTKSGPKKPTKSKHHHRSPSPTPSHSQPQPVSSIPEPEKKIVLVCNLDPRATAEDVGEACSMFGPILSCDMLLDPMGRPLNEAEIEFMYADSAKECVTKLDNTLADGRLLRAKLQDAPTQSVKPRYSSRSVVGSARLQPGAFDNTSAMIQPPPPHHQYQQPNYPPVYSSQPYYPQQPQPQPHYSQNQYRRY